MIAREATGFGETIGSRRSIRAGNEAEGNSGKLARRPTKLRRRLTLLIIGPNASGKSTCARYFASALNGVIIEFGDMVRRQIQADSTLARDPSLAYEELLRRHGPSILARWARIASSVCGETQAFIMVGVRDEPAYRSLLVEFPAAIRIAVLADQATRHARDRSRESRPRASATLDEVEFAQRDTLHRRWGLDILLAEANYTVRNDESTEALYEHLDLLVSRLIGGPSDDKPSSTT